MVLQLKEKCYCTSIGGFHATRTYISNVAHCFCGFQQPSARGDHGARLGHVSGSRFEFEFEFGFGLVHCDLCANPISEPSLHSRIPRCSKGGGWMSGVCEVSFVGKYFVRVICDARSLNRGGNATVINRETTISNYSRSWYYPMARY